MKVNEIFKSIQGESSFQGLPCVFVRLTGCNLRCSWCDTTYAYEEGEEMSVDEIIKKVEGYHTPLVEITGGEPLLQEEVYPLTKRLLDLGYKVLIETNGSLDIGRLDKRVIKILDIKCPGSGESDKMRWENLDRLSPKDEVKFVLSNREDYQWAKGVIERYGLADRVTILLSVVYGRLDPKDLAQWILEDNLNVRLQLQLQKYIWGASVNTEGTKNTEDTKGTEEHGKAWRV